MQPLLPTQPDALYAQARQILQANPAMGKKKLAELLGVRTPTSRRLQERFRGETQGQGTHPDYIRVLQLKTAHPDWGASRIAGALAISVDHAKLHLARFLGAQSYSGTAQPQATPASAPRSHETAPLQNGMPSNGNEFQDTIQGDARDLSSRGTEIRTVDDLMVAGKVDTHVWSLARHSLSLTERPLKNPITGEVETQKIVNIRAALRRRTPELYLEDVLASLEDRLRNAAPHRPALVYSSPRGGLLEISVMDLHLGKFCSQAEGGRAYDPDIAERCQRRNENAVTAPV